MSEAVEGQGSAPERENVEEQAPVVNTNDLLTRIERLEASKKRVEDESKSWKAKYQGVRSEVEEQKTSEMKQSNDFKGLYEKAMEQIDDLRDTVKSEKQGKLETTLKYEVAKNAKDADDMDILLGAIKLKKRDVIGFDKENNQWLGVDQAVDELRKSNPGLFDNQRPGFEGGRPQAALPKDKTIDELIDENPMDVFKESLSKLI